MLLLANSRVLFDFEMVCLITLFLGLGVFGIVFNTFKKENAPRGIGSECLWFDLILVWVPLSMSVVTPVLLYLFGESSSKEVNLFEVQITQFFYFIVIGFITWVMIWLLDYRKPKKILGFSRQPVVNIVIYGFAGGILAYLFCGFLIGNLSGMFLSEVIGPLEEQKTVEMMRQLKAKPLLLLLAAINVCIGAPIVEELLFRGYLYPTIKRFSSPLFAALTTGALFAVVHNSIASLLPLWVLAVLLCLVYEYTRSIWVPIAIHAVFNLIGVCLIILTQAPELKPVAAIFFP